MGGFNRSLNNVQQVVPLGGNDVNMHCQAAYYKGSSREFVYVWSENDPLRAIPFDRASNLSACRARFSRTYKDRRDKAGPSVGLVEWVQEPEPESYGPPTPRPVTPSTKSAPES